MIDVVSVSNMRDSDAYTIKNFVESKELMRRAGYGISCAYDYKDKKILIVCGKGNNGGDGFALASILKDDGIQSDILVVSDEVSIDSTYFKNQCIEKNISISLYNGAYDFNSYDVIVDCLLGTGFTGVPRGVYKDLIQEINSTTAFVISADINSGVNGDTGEYEIAVRSDLTVTIGYLKKGLVLLDPEMAKRIVVADIGIVLLNEEEKICSKEEYNSLQFDSDQLLEGQVHFAKNANIDFNVIDAK